jgi:transposase
LFGSRVAASLPRFTATGPGATSVEWAKSVLSLTVQIVKHPGNTSGFTVLPCRWVVERTFGWLLRYRRLVRDYDRRPDHHEARVLWASVTVMTRKL